MYLPTQANSMPPIPLAVAFYPYRYVLNSQGFDPVILDPILPFLKDMITEKLVLCLDAITQ